MLSSLTRGSGIGRRQSHCNTLQHTATYCNTLQHTATHCNTLQRIATHGNILHHTTVVATPAAIRVSHWQARHRDMGGDTLQHTTLLQHRDIATRCHTLPPSLGIVTWASDIAWQLPCDTATHCNTLLHCNALQRIATHCNYRVLVQIVAVLCSALQSLTVCCIVLWYDRQARSATD